MRKLPLRPVQQVQSSPTAAPAHTKREGRPELKSEKSERIVDLAASLAAKADDIDQVLILYRSKERDGQDDFQGSMDNELTLSESLWLVEGFKFWLQAGALGLLKEKN
jgi:hypothetical protein